MKLITELPNPKMNPEDWLIDGVFIWKETADRFIDRYIKQLLLRAAMHSQRMFEPYSPAEKQTILREMNGLIRRNVEPNRNVILERFNVTPKTYSKAGTEA